MPSLRPETEPAGPGLEALYLDGTAGRLCTLLHSPAPDMPVRGALLYLHPFAEEMNKSRRMAALQARAFARAGWWVMQQDCFGCGDSEGEFGEAAWQTWVDDAVAAATWLRQRCGFDPVLWGLRAGCLLAVAAAAHLPAGRRLLFWQPAGSGKQQLQQFLRLKVAGGMLADGKAAGEGTRQLREQLQSGVAVEVAGYRLAPALAMGLDAAALAPPATGGRVDWLEMAGGASQDLSPAARNAIKTWEAAGWQVGAQAVAGASFWQTVEIEEAPLLIERTSGCLALEPA